MFNDRTKLADGKKKIFFHCKKIRYPLRNPKRRGISAIYRPLLWPPQSS